MRSHVGNGPRDGDAAVCAGRCKHLGRRRRPHQLEQRVREPPQHARQHVAHKPEGRLCVRRIGEAPREDDRAAVAGGGSARLRVALDSDRVRNDLHGRGARKEATDERRVAVAARPDLVGGPESRPLDQLESLCEPGRHERRDAAGTT